jgi:hypothetical protein
MKLFTSFGTRSAKAVTRCVRPSFELLEARDVPSATSFLPTSNFGTNLLGCVAQSEYYQDGNKLSRADVVHLFDVADGTEQPIFQNAGPSGPGAPIPPPPTVSFQVVQNPDPSALVPALWVSDLKGLIQNGRQWRLARDVVDLAGKVVGVQPPAKYNLAPVTWLGSVNLSTGDSAGTLTGLVNTWFKGMDLPAITGAGVTYQPAQGALFGPQGPQANDVAQGKTADCYFLSSLAEVAQQAPQYIDHMFSENSDGTYTVRFFNNSQQADYVTVDNELPANATGEFVYANALLGGQQTNIASSQNVLWAALAEKAYAQLAAEGWSRSYSPGNSINSYAALDFGNYPIASEQITGGHPTQRGLPDQFTFDELVNSFEHHDLVLASTPDPTQPLPDPRVIKNHVYYMTGFDAKNHTITLSNGYWTGNQPGYQKTVTLTMEEFLANFSYAAVIAP